MTSVTVGVHVHAQPERLRETLDSLRRGGGPTFRLLVLPDGPDAQTASALATLDVLQDGTSDPRGAPACFNRLARACDDDVIVLVESGCVAGPGWLAGLLAALEGDARNGLVGPSTNAAWNAQAVFRERGGTPAEVAATAAEASTRFGAEWRSLAPLHALADFCFAVRRPVVDAVGAADEGFALGPCWEMEYVARALRAGFDAVWACGAYVHRAPFTPRRAREEAARFRASKHRYQDAVCGLRLRGESAAYEPHCRGEACEHFAPAELMRIHRPLDSPAAVKDSPPAPAHGAPLVSCIMPTRDRAEFVLQAVRYFQRQDYAPLELIIVDDGDDGLGERLPADPRIRYLRAPGGESIGAKRNRACQAASGEFIVHWDDDDWFAAERVRRQLAPLRTGEADVTALRAGTFFDLEHWRFWRCTPELQRRLFTEGVHGATLAYRKSLWVMVPFPTASLAEDAWFLRGARRAGARITPLDNDGLFVYLRHGSNAWRFPCGEYLDPGGWRRTTEPPLSPEDRAFYAARSAAAPQRRVPLVSCVMPTADRRGFVEHAIRYFLRQDHPARELIVLDDGHDRVEDLMSADERIRYLGLEQPLVLGAKRNLGCELARGEIVAHWDDDDWTAPHRLRVQVDALQRHGVDTCGAARQFYIHADRREAWLYAYPAGRRPWVAGNSLCYTRDVWKRAPFPEIAVGEDTRFVWNGAAHGLHALEDHRFIVGLVHATNASRKHTGDPWWSRIPVEEVEAVLGDDAEVYLGARV